MNRIVPEPISRQPWSLFVPLLLLVLFGAAVLHSAAGGSMTPYASSHLVRFGVFVLVALALSFMTRRFVRLVAYPAYVAVLLLLVVVEAMGAIGGGSQRWINIGPLVLQPSELMKAAIVVVLARFFETLPVGMVNTWRALVPPLVMIGLPVMLVLTQPDLGTALAILFGGGLVMFFAGLPLRWFVGAGAAGALVVPLAFFFLLQDYQQRRITTLFDPGADPLGAGYHITQSKIAIGSGGWFGKGFGNGTQSHLNYLPEPHTDFVFATMAEEWGLAGGLFVLLMYLLILRWGFAVALSSEDRLGRLIAAGAVATIFFYIAVNLLMVMGFAPVVGIPLPFLSHGGSALLTVMICIGLLLMVHRWNTRVSPRGLS
ncbi:rod shape-determining protein RodA [Erythrobacteraceae bacterium CFH 75059]|uniref:rod shape-determining protein RodA n=1 Tax=Qipengyuania thermophila TaxID=2509361 RepID=UPI001022724A|nr:rod shape-determining protein RodA [Qipengyuania thermophila]TCD05142.1 rod shape-determining protein RodA [Erythrobacteraceae bacterium CFH 75059]